MGRPARGAREPVTRIDPLPLCSPTFPSGRQDAFRFGSIHAGGLNMLYCDGTIRFVGYDIDPDVFTASGSCNQRSLGRRDPMIEPRTEFVDFGFAGIHRWCMSAVAWIGFSIALPIIGGCTKADPFSAETAALKTLIDDYKMEWSKKDESGRVIAVRLEGPRFNDQALAVAGTFKELEGISLSNSKITDEGLEKLPVLKILQRIRITGTGVTDRGLLAIRTRMPSLKQVWLNETDKLTPVGIDGLKKSNPSVSIHVENTPNKKAAK
jgi:prepilin-type processing-associated H-X9-DG protein